MPNKQEAQKYMLTLAQTTEEQQHSMSANISTADLKKRKLLHLNELDQNWVAEDRSRANAANFTPKTLAN